MLLSVHMRCSEQSANEHILSLSGVHIITLIHCEATVERRHTRAEHEKQHEWLHTSFSSCATNILSGVDLHAQTVGTLTVQTLMHIAKRDCRVMVPHCPLCDE